MWACRLSIRSSALFLLQNPSGRLLKRRSSHLAIMYSSIHPFSFNSGRKRISWHCFPFKYNNWWQQFFPLAQQASMMVKLVFSFPVVTTFTDFAPFSLMVVAIGMSNVCGTASMLMMKSALISLSAIFPTTNS